MALSAHGSELVCAIQPRHSEPEAQATGQYTLQHLAVALNSDHRQASEHGLGTNAATDLDFPAPQKRTALGSSLRF